MKSRTVIAAAALFAIVVVALYGASVNTAHTPQRAEATAASGSVEVMQMMKNAKELPDQRFDAH